MLKATIDQIPATIGDLQKELDKRIPPHFLSTLAAALAYETAAKALVKQVEQDFPIGTVIEATLGSYRLRLRVTNNAPAWWHRPSDLLAVNIKTDKVRAVDPTSESQNVVIISRP